MKQVNSFLIAFMLFFIGTQVNGQIGIRGGVNFAKVEYSDDVPELDIKNTLGYQIGLFYDAPLTESIYFRPAVIYSVKGSDLEVLDESSKLESSYIEIPFDFMFKIPAGYNDLGIYAGPYAGFLVDAALDDEDVKELYESLDFGFNLGLVYELESGFGVGLNYGLGLANINDNDLDDISTDDFDIKNRNISAYVTYKF